MRRSRQNFLGQRLFRHVVKTRATAPLLLEKIGMPNRCRAEVHPTQTDARIPDTAARSSPRRLYSHSGHRMSLSMGGLSTISGIFRHPQLRNCAANAIADSQMINCTLIAIAIAWRKRKYRPIAEPSR